MLCTRDRTITDTPFWRLIKMQVLRRAARPHGAKRHGGKGMFARDQVTLHKQGDRRVGTSAASSQRTSSRVLPWTQRPNLGPGSNPPPPRFRRGLDPGDKLAFISHALCHFDCSTYSVFFCLAELEGMRVPFRSQI